MDWTTWSHLHARDLSSLGAQFTCARGVTSTGSSKGSPLYQGLLTAHDLKLISSQEFLNTIARVYGLLSFLFGKRLFS